MSGSVPIPARAPAFTLVEMVVSLAITSVLMVGMASVVMLSGQTIPSPDSPTSGTLAVSLGLRGVAADLQEATGFTVATSRVMEFTVPDRDNPPDGSEETIRYEWSGTPGDPLTRTINGGSAFEVIDSLHSFIFGLETAEEPLDVPPPLVEGPEQLLQQHYSSSGAEWGTEVLTGGARLGAYLRPALSSEAVEFRVTRVRFYGSPYGYPTGELGVSVREPEVSGIPSDAVVEEVRVLESTILSNSWHTTYFLDAGGLLPADGCFVVFDDIGPYSAAEIVVETDASSRSDRTVYLDSGDGSWKQESTMRVALLVYGRVSTPDLSFEPPNVTRINAVEVTASVTPASSSRVRTAVQTLNRPEAP